MKGKDFKQWIETVSTQMLRIDINYYNSHDILRIIVNEYELL